MKRGLALLLLGCVVLACGAPTASPTGAPTSSPTTEPTLEPTAPPTPDLPTLPLPAEVAGIPGADDFTVELQPQTPAGSVRVGLEQTHTLEHCGLISPIDVDGSLWDPVFGDDGHGGPLTEDQKGDLINATPVVFALVDHETMFMLTQHGARVVLTRHDGPRPYFGCD